MDKRANIFGLFAGVAMFTALVYVALTNAKEDPPTNALPDLLDDQQCCPDLIEFENVWWFDENTGVMIYDGDTLAFESP